ncbi:MAG: TraB/GumN family protein [Ignavibacteria bacterium]|nr:TraB/GumN family protein [Ignavibacteria bacterium]
MAIGALHLTGEKSILLLLEKEGYRVEPVLGGKRSQWLFNEFGDD